MKAKAMGQGGMSIGEQLGAFWRERAKRERQVIAAMAVLIGGAALWVGFLQPPLATLRATPERMKKFEAPMAQIQALAAEAKELKAVPPVSAQAAGAALRTATERLGEKAKFMLQGDRASVSFSGVSPEAFKEWLSEARGAARARPMEANMTRAGDGYTGTVVLSVGGSQ